VGGEVGGEGSNLNIVDDVLWTSGHDSLEAFLFRSDTVDRTATVVQVESQTISRQ